MDSRRQEPLAPPPPPPPPPRFLADAMLGRLARWLRMLGFDTAYPGDHGDRQPSDEALLVRAVAEGRLLLTRDKGLGQRPGVFLVKSDDVQEQLRELAEALGNEFRERLGRAEPRCSLCNGELERLRVPGPLKREIEGPVTNSHSPPGTLTTGEWEGLPPGVRALHREFWRCTECAHLYWEGTHWVNIKKAANQLKGDLGGRSST